MLVTPGSWFDAQSGSFGHEHGLPEALMHVPIGHTVEIAHFGSPDGALLSNRPHGVRSCLSPALTLSHLPLLPWVAGQPGTIEFHGLRAQFTAQWAAVFSRVLLGSTDVLNTRQWGPGWAFELLARTLHMKRGLFACMFSYAACFVLMPDLWAGSITDQCG